MMQKMVSFLRNEYKIDRLYPNFVDSLLYVFRTPSFKIPTKLYVMCQQFWFIKNVDMSQPFVARITGQDKLVSFPSY